MCKIADMLSVFYCRNLNTKYCPKRDGNFNKISKVETNHKQKNCVINCICLKYSFL